ncbi:hypothetical protein HK100_012412 [Physocladia obscura]|uniref:RNI-like protein n=1 Tax=Physocladia obscura TaxID=109957 RepID=A0AAD5T193_9FUNG|nr:hypothetical protein HK100_012412 [Physocladia obscura]
MGDIETVLGLASGSLVSFRLAGCLHVSSKIIQSLADFVPSLAHLDLAGCPVGDGYMGDLVRGCPGLRTLDLSGTNVTLRASLELLLCGLRAVKAARFEGLGQGDDTDADTQNDYVRPNATPTSTPRSRRSSFVPSATVTATAKTIISSARGPTALALTSASFSGASLSLKDMKVIASRAPNITHLSFLACDSLSDAHISTYLDALLLSSSNVPPSSVQKQLPQGYATPRLESLDLDGCEELTSVSVIALSEAFAGVRKLGQVSAPRHDAPTNMLDLLDGRTGRLKFLTVSSLRVVGLGGTQVGGEAVRVLVRECGALEEVRLDRCEILVHTYLEVVGIECWMQLQEEKEQRKRRQSLILSKKNNSGVARKESTLSIGSNSGGGSSRLPVPVKKLVVNSSVGMGINMTTPPASPMYGTSALLTGGKRGMPEGWLRLIGEAALKKVSDYEGSF